MTNWVIEPTLLDRINHLKNIVLIANVFFSNNDSKHISWYIPITEQLQSYTVDEVEALFPIGSQVVAFIQEESAIESPNWLQGLERLFIVNGNVVSYDGSVVLLAACSCQVWLRHTLVTRNVPQCRVDLVFGEVLFMINDESIKEHDERSLSDLSSSGNVSIELYQVPMSDVKINRTVPMSTVPFEMVALVSPKTAMGKIISEFKKSMERHFTLYLSKQLVAQYVFNCSCGLVSLSFHDSKGLHDPEEAEWEKERRNYHLLFGQDMTFPLFRSHCRYPLLPRNTTKVLLSKDNFPSPSSFLIQGRVAYYHYNHDNENDQGWGCAYRVCQSISSWYYLQGYSPVSPSSIREIQAALVDIEDKPESFLGSNQWIGSVEVSLYLSVQYHVTSKMVHIPKGGNVPSDIIDTLIHHFKVNGTPVFIGGDRLAYMLIGIQSVSKKVKWLIVDPHYIGSDESVVKKCVEWKDTVKVFKPNDFYNICLPLKSKCCI